MRWQRLARIAIALFVVGFIVVVVLAVRRPQRPPADDGGIDFTDKDVLSEIRGGLVEHNWGEGYALTADTRRVYPDGRVIHTKVTLVLPDRGGRNVTISTDELEVLVADGEVGTAKLRGDVRLVTDDGLDLRAGEATYDRAEGLLRIPGPVTFTRGRMSGSGVGATYDERRDVVWLLDKARIVVAADATGEGGLESTSAAAGLARGEQYALLTGGAHIVGPGRDLRADEITIRMTADNERVQALELRVNSHITGGTQAGDAMSARDIDLRYDDDGRALRQARLVDDSVVHLPAEGGGRRRVAGRTIDIDLAPDGTTVTALRAAEAVQLDLPREAPGGPERRISANLLDATGAEGAGLQAATFTGHVEYREIHEGGTRLASAARLDVRTAPNLGAIQEADFRGNVQITDPPDLTAKAPRVLYHVARDRMELSPGSGDPGPEPEVTDGRTTVKARTIDIGLATRSMTAETDVQSTLQPRRRGEKPQAGDAGRLPAMLKDDEEVFVTANRLVYDGAAEQATYTGNASLWQEETRIQADVIELDENGGNLTARTKVRTTMPMTEVDPKTKARTTSPAEGEAELFVYDDSKRMATYTTAAHLVGAQGDLWAARIELFLAAKSNDLERLEAYDAVTIREGVRTAQGERLTYTTADEEYVLTGPIKSPVVIVENLPTECRKSQSRRVTFRRASDYMVMERPVSLECTAEDRLGSPADKRSLGAGRLGSPADKRSLGAGRLGSPADKRSLGAGRLGSPADKRSLGAGR
jgi:lipopolysaccharide export system protein LptA